MLFLYDYLVATNTITKKIFINLDVFIGNCKELTDLSNIATELNKFIDSIEGLREKINNKVREDELKNKSSKQKRKQKQKNPLVFNVLNSKLNDWYYCNISVQLGKKGIRHFNIYIEQIPIKEPTTKEQTAIENLVKQILSKKKTDNNCDTSQLETKINKLVYEMYKISPDDLKLIDKQNDK